MNDLFGQYAIWYEQKYGYYHFHFVDGQIMSHWCPVIDKNGVYFKERVKIKGDLAIA